jgi:hypothetical protein
MMPDFDQTIQKSSSRTIRLLHGVYQFIGDKLIMPYNGEDTGFAIFDTSNPSLPTLSHYYKFDNFEVDWTSSFILQGTIGYTLEHHQGFKVYDFSDLNDIKRVGMYDFGDGYEGENNKMVIDGNYAYIWGQNRKAVIEISDATSPQLIYHESLNYSRDVDEMVKMGDRLYISRGESTVAIIDVSTPSSPNYLGDFTLPDSEIRALGTDGNYLYISAGVSGNEVLGRFAESGDTLINVMPSVNIVNNESAGSMIVEGGYVYLVHWSGVNIYSVSDATNPPVLAKEVDAINRSGNDYALLHDNHIFTFQTDIISYDVSDIAAAYYKGRSNLEGTTDRIVVEGNYAYTLENEKGLRIIDLTTLKSVSLFNYLTNGDHYNPTKIVKRGNYLFIANEGWNVYIVNVSDPTSPSLVTMSNDGGYSSDLALSSDGTRLYTVGGSGMKVYSLLNINSNTLSITLAEDTTYTNLNKIVIEDNKAYVIQNNAALLEFNIDTAIPSYNRVVTYFSDIRDLVIYQGVIYLIEEGTIIKSVTVAYESQNYLDHVEGKNYNKLTLVETDEGGAFLCASLEEHTFQLFDVTQSGSVKELGVKAYEWEEINSVNDIAVKPEDPTTLYIASSDHGVTKLQMQGEPNTQTMTLENQRFLTLNELSNFYTAKVNIDGEYYIYREVQESQGESDTNLVIKANDIIDLKAYDQALLAVSSSGELKRYSLSADNNSMKLSQSYTIESGNDRRKLYFDEKQTLFYLTGSTLYYYNVGGTSMIESTTTLEDEPNSIYIVDDLLFASYENYGVRSYSIDRSSGTITKLKDYANIGLQVDNVYSTDGTSFNYTASGVLKVFFIDEELVDYKSLATYKILEEGDILEGEGCFIATAAYGSYFESHVSTLRSFRDEVMLSNTLGRWLVKQYYSYSPPIAEYIAKREGLKSMVRLLLTPLVYIIDYPIIVLLIIIMIIIARREKRRVVL